MSKHTAGPWRLHQNWIDAGRYGSEEICSFCCPLSDQEYDNYEANGRLIAAAPELLKALIQAVAWMDGEQTPIDSLVRARKIIAKAKGEQA